MSSLGNFQRETAVAEHKLLESEPLPACNSVQDATASLAFMATLAF
jgi:hypothetical protein